MSKTIHIGNKRFPADQVPDKYKHLVKSKADKPAATKPTPAKLVKSGD